MKKIAKILILILALAALLLLCAQLIPFILSLREPQARLEFKNTVSSLGALGVLAMLILQLIQVVVAIIPGEPIELVMGLMYGTLGGLALTLVGLALGMTIIFLAVRRFGVGFAKKFVDTDSFDKLKFLKNPSKRDGLIFVLFLIPGTPKDLLTYFAPFTGIGFARFLTLSLLARIPSVISSTIVGASVGEGNLTRSIIIFAATAVIGAVGIFVNSRLQNKLSKESNNNDSNDNRNQDNLKG